MKQTLMVIGVLVVGYAVVLVVRVLRYIRAGRVAAKVTQPYNRILDKAGQHILVLGDSTMYGAGIKNPEHTVGGLLAAKYPDASIETLAINGARVKDLQAQIAQARYRHYDLMVVGAGGNDIVHLGSYVAVHRRLVAFLRKASEVSGQIILCHSVNIGNIGFFPFPLNYLFDYRSRQLSRLYDDVSRQFPKVKYVNFYRPMNDDHYDKLTRKEFIAEDAFHPNDYANLYFFDQIWREIQRGK